MNNTATTTCVNYTLVVQYEGAINYTATPAYDPDTGDTVLLSPENPTYPGSMFNYIVQGPNVAPVSKFVCVTQTSASSTLIASTNTIAYGFALIFVFIGISLAGYIFNKFKKRKW